MIGFVALMALVDVFAGILGLRKRTPEQSRRAAPASMFNAATVAGLAVLIGLGPRAWLMLVIAGALTLHDHARRATARDRPGR